MTPLIPVALATTAFVGSHLALSHPLRRPVVDAVGERGFMLAYPLVRNPAMPNASAAPAVATGVFAITRHPMMWSFALWARATPRSTRSPPDAPGSPASAATRLAAGWWCGWPLPGRTARSPVGASASGTGSGSARRLSMILHAAGSRALA